MILLFLSVLTLNKILIMSTLRNKVLLIGHVGQDPEIKVFENNRRNVRFNMATNEYFTNAKGEKTHKTTWHIIVAWGNLVDLVDSHVKKGKQIAIDGKLTYRDYVDKDGNSKSITEVIIQDLILL